MDNNYILIDCSSLYKFLHQLKDLLKHHFKVYVKIEDLKFKIFGNNESKNDCKTMVNYFQNADSQYLLAVNEYTRNAFSITDFVLYFESKCKVLILLDDSTMYLYGENVNVVSLYEYLLKHQKLVESEEIPFLFTEEDDTRLEVLCCLCDIRLPENVDDKTKVFVYKILLDRDNLFTELPFDKLSIELDNICPSNGFTKQGMSEPCADARVAISSEAIPSKYSVQEDELKVGNISKVRDKNSKFKTIIIDGNNLAFGHGGDKFSYKGIQIAVDFFVSRGHSKVYAMLPRHKKRIGGTIFDKLEREDRLKYTPSRKFNNVRETPYDDRFILDAAVATNGVVVSNDQFRDLMDIEEYKDIICNRLIPYTFIEDHIIIPNDPRGCKGPSLVKILGSSNKVAPKGPKKATTPKKPKHQSRSTNTGVRRSQSQHRDLNSRQSALYRRLSEAMPDASVMIRRVIIDHPEITDANSVMNMALNALYPNNCRL